MKLNEINLQGMLGLGDNLHQRAVVRQLMQSHRVWLATPWPSVYHDLVGDGLKIYPRPSVLRTQEKNRQREQGKYTAANAPGAKTSTIWYTHDQIRAKGSFLAAMCDTLGLPKGDFSLPVPRSWIDEARQLVGNDPIMLYRPLVDRTEWNGCRQRNPDHQHYHDLAQQARAGYKLVSIADLEPGKEWECGIDVKPDIAFHKGELTFEQLAGLYAIAGLVFCSPGFSIILAQAVGAPFIAVFGGHESARLYDHGQGCFIQPIKPCECFSKTHTCDKRIDMPAAQKQIEDYLCALA